MKKLFLILISILFSIVVWSQSFETFGNISEIERSNHKYSNGPLVDDFKDISEFITLEDHLYNFEKRFGLKNLQSLLNSIENNDTIYISELKNKSEAMYNYADHLRLIITNNKTSFIYKGKLYVLTYEPTNRTNSFGVELEIKLIHERKLYLYCKTGHEWIKVSGVIDKHVNTDYFMKELTPGRKPSPDNPQSSRPIINFKEKPVTIQYYVTICNTSKNGKENYHKELSDIIIKLYDKNSILYTDDRK